LNLTDTRIRELRKFGFIVGSVLIGFGLFPLLKNNALGVHFLLPGILFIITAIVSPSLFSPVYKLWMRVGHSLGRVNSFILLSIVFYVFLTPMSLAMKLFEKEKKFSFKIQKDSCWIKRDRENFKETMKRQF
jgi:Saxitoxin biosynthesis operon protein SxtJ